jgi:hypothetical protein
MRSGSSSARAWASNSRRLSPSTLPVSIFSILPLPSPRSFLLFNSRLSPREWTAQPLDERFLLLLGRCKQLRTSENVPSRHLGE